MKTKISIKIHSFVDLITNSSSEIFVQANDKTIESIKEIVNNLLGIANSELKFDDLFTAHLQVMDYDSYEYIKESEVTEEHKTENYDGYSESQVTVEVKSGVEDERAKSAAKLLSNLENLFSMSSVYNG